MYLCLYEVSTCIIEDVTLLNRDIGIFPQWYIFDFRSIHANTGHHGLCRECRKEMLEIEACIVNVDTITLSHILERSWTSSRHVIHVQEITLEHCREHWAVATKSMMIFTHLELPWPEMIGSLFRKQNCVLSFEGVVRKNIRVTYVATQCLVEWWHLGQG